MRDPVPLNALRAFETAARTGSFVAAAAELGVTAAAVSWQVRTLETHLGKKLFLRRGNRILMTDAGQAIQPRLDRAFADLARIAADLREARGRSRLVVSVAASVADLWLIPSLAGFPRPDGLDLRVEDDPVALAPGGADVRIAYGAQLYPGRAVEPLFRDRVVPVAAPDFLAGRTLAELPDSGFIHTDWGPTFATVPAWPAWFAAAGLTRAPDLTRGLRVGFSGLAIAAARAGLGVALAPERLATPDLDSRRLVRADPQALPMPADYVAILAGAPARARLVRALIDHLRGGSPPAAARRDHTTST